MHDVLRQRLLRKIDSLPDEQVYQVLDYIEFLESKYARHLPQEATGLQKFAEGLEDRLRRKAVSPATIREAFQLIAAADRVLSSVSTAGTRLLGELGAMGEEDGGQGAGPPSGRRPPPPRSGSAGGSRPAAGETPPHGDPLRTRHEAGEAREGPSGEG
ncbi:MAG: DUF2281 domain-containing protein [Gemmatimonadetes bacterium]|nr:DUF2281 domain-containing protein [Gemmatimonadota bacterium]